MKTMRVSFILACCLIAALSAASEQHATKESSGLTVEPQASLMGATGQSSWTQLAQFEHTHPSGGDQFGFSVTISGDTAVVGAPSGIDGLGAAYVFVKPARGWGKMIQTATLTASDEMAYDEFGASVSIDGNTVVVGSPCASFYNSSCGKGAAYVFVKPAGGWRNMTETAKLSAADGNQNDQFGYSVSISGSTVVAGASNHAGQGATYVFVKKAQEWGQAAELTASDGASGDGLGESVSVNGNAVAAGSPFKDSYQGAAYIFVEPGGGWKDETQTAELTASDGAPNYVFGLSLSVDANTAVVGAPGYGRDGGAYVYVEPPNGWTNATETAKLTGYSGRKGFASSVVIGGSTVLVGQPKLGRGSIGKKGAVFAFIKPADGWKSTSKFSQELTAATGKYEHYFGTSVALTSDTAIIGAPNVTTDHGRPGSAYIFGRGK